ncbi:MAG: hypothetical protein R3Y11_01015 [Pseudomonadota bacterium]
MKARFTALALAATMVVPALAQAHSPLFDCYDNGDGTVMCQGGFSDGSSASGVKITITDGAGAVLQTLNLDANSECTFDKPEGDYKVGFYAGEGHSIDIDGADIVE